jgi:hypothetical protein
LGFYLPAYNYGTFATALTRTGLYKLLQGTTPYTVLAVPNQFFINPYSTSYFPPALTSQQVLTMNLDTLTRIMQLHILPGRHFMSDFMSYPYDGSVLETFGPMTYSKPLAFPTIGQDSIYVIPNGSGVGVGISAPGFFVFGEGNLLYGRGVGAAPKNYNNQFAAMGIPTGLRMYNVSPGVTNNLQAQDVVAPNGVIQYLYENELVPR